MNDAHLTTAQTRPGTHAATAAGSGTLHGFLTASITHHAERVAVNFEGRDLSYHELDTRSNQLAHHLRTLGVGPGVLVGVCCERGLELLPGLLGILKAGGAYVPLDPALSLIHI